MSASTAPVGTIFVAVARDGSVHCAFAVTETYAYAVLGTDPESGATVPASWHWAEAPAHAGLERARRAGVIRDGYVVPVRAYPADSKEAILARGGVAPATAGRNELEAIARTCLGVETLEERGRTWLDFHELAVWQIEEALSAAYEAGRRSAGEAR